MTRGAEYDILKQYCEYINNKYDLVNDISKIHVSKIVNNNIDKTLRKIDKLINASYNNLLFVLTNTSDVLINRICDRNRDNEVKNINYENVMYQINYYNKC